MNDQLRHLRESAARGARWPLLAMERRCPHCGRGTFSRRRYPICADRDGRGKRLSHRVWCAEFTFKDEVCRQCSAEFKVLAEWGIRDFLADIPAAQLEAFEKEVIKEMGR